MQIANIMLNLGGDQGNQVQKYDVTPSEVHVLQILHGEDAVSDIDIIGEAKNEDGSKRTSKQERERLVEIYKRAQADGSVRSPAVDMLFPGVAARLYETFDEMDLDESFFRAEVVSRSKKKAADPLDHDNDGRKGGTAPSAETGLKGMTVPQLKEYAEKNEIDLKGASKKPDILAEIEKAEAQAKSDEPDTDAGEAEGDDGEFGEMPDANLFK